VTRILAAILLAASLGAAACTALPVPLPPPPPAAPAPAALAGISIYVHQAEQPAENEDDKYDYTHTPGFTSELRSAFGVAAARAGYKVAVDRRTGADLTALVYEEWQWVSSDTLPRPDGVATLVLRDRDGVTVERFAVPVPTFGEGYESQLLQEHAAAALVSAMGRSEALVLFAEDRARKRALVIAAPAEPATPAPPPMTFADAVKDAAEAFPFEVSTGLVPILPTTPKLVWSDQAQKKRVLMVTWTSYKGYDEQAGKSVPLGRETWVTPAPFVAEICKGKGGDAAALSLRLEQLLGLPANSGKDRFVELWTEPKDLFRPCPDPEITDRECETDFPQPSSLVTVSPAHVKWFEDLKAKSYGENGYPWTRLGYTYDWAGPKVGVSELVIKKGAEVTVQRVTSTVDYCQ